MSHTPTKAALLPERLYSHGRYLCLTDDGVEQGRIYEHADYNSTELAAELVRRYNAHEQMAATLRVAASTLGMAPDDEIVVAKTLQRIWDVLAQLERQP